PVQVREEQVVSQRALGGPRLQLAQVDAPVGELAQGVVQVAGRVDGKAEDDGRFVPARRACGDGETLVRRGTRKVRPGTRRARPGAWWGSAFLHDKKPGRVVRRVLNVLGRHGQTVQLGRQLGAH